MTDTASKTIDCLACKKSIDLDTFISRCDAFWRELFVVHFTCPACQQVTVAQLERQRISLGYLYAAGTPHFCAVIDHEVDELRAWREGEGLDVELGERCYSVQPMRRT